MHVDLHWVYNMLLSQIGQRIRNYRKKRQLTQQALAINAQVSLRFLVQLEAGKGNISVQRLAEVCSVLGVSLSTLFQGLGPGEPTILALVGMRGAGKSTIGQQFAKEISLPFIEIDQLIARRANMGLSGLFELGGEAYYRELEAQVLQQLTNEGRACVLATGGSIVSSSENWRQLRSIAQTVWLRASPNAHLQRVHEQGDLRPMEGMVDALGQLKAILAQRSPYYAEADLQIDTERLGIAGSVAELRRFFG